MGICDIIILILLLLFLIVGIKRGFIKQISGFICLVAAIILTVIFFKQAAEYFQTTNMYSNLFNKIATWISSKGTIFSMSISDVTDADMKSALSSMNIPGFLQGIFTSKFASVQANASFADITLTEYFTPIICVMIAYVISFIALFVGSFIILRLIFMIFRKAIKSIEFFNSVDKFFGAVWSLVLCTTIISVVMLVITLLTGAGSLGNSIEAWAISDMRLDQDGFGIAKLFYQHNLILRLISSISFGDIVNSIFGISIF
ncbi:MAG: CvpA family protein [Bacilli bacterium]